ncbi:MAG: type III-B CRISPR module RAMP protein Cmr1 [Deltaproteobacteria bacterium]|nr:type III-B CRISPR module RAMP protein Cmr1 [Deltaproteobacteria bacterium]
MKKRCFELELISPMAMGGATAGQPDAWGLRPPSIKGVMRYWFRALAGGVMGTDPDAVEKLRDWEEAIFGSTDQGSSFRLRLVSWQKIDWIFKKIDYATFSFRKTKERPYNLKGFRYCSRAKLEISYHPAIIQRKGLSVDQIDYLVSASLYLAVILGGFGSRSRRGVGSVSFTASDQNLVERGFFNPAAYTDNDIDALCSKLKESLVNIRKKFSEFLCNGTITAISGLPAFHVIHQDYIKIFISAEDINDTQELIEIYENARKYYWAKGKRNKKIIPALGTDHDTIANLANGIVPDKDNSPVLNKPALGLPLPYFFKGKVKIPKITLIASYGDCQNDRQAINRRGSPVFLSFIRCGHRVHGCAVIFFSRFAGFHDQITICKAKESKDELTIPVGQALYANNRETLGKILDPLCSKFRDGGWTEINLA